MTVLGIEDISVNGIENPCSLGALATSLYLIKKKFISNNYNYVLMMVFKLCSNLPEGALD